MGRINRVQEGGAVDLSYTSLVYPASSEFIRGMTSASLMILSLSGCITTPVAQKVYINVPTPCITTDQLPAAPKASTDADLAKLDDGDLVLTLAADRIEYRRHSNEASAVLVACTK